MRNLNERMASASRLLRARARKKNERTREGNEFRLCAIVSFGIYTRHASHPFKSNQSEKASLCEQEQEKLWIKKKIRKIEKRREEKHKEEKKKWSKENGKWYSNEFDITKLPLAQNEMGFGYRVIATVSGKHSSSENSEHTLPLRGTIFFCCFASPFEFMRVLHVLLQIFATSSLESADTINNKICTGALALNEEKKKKISNRAQSTRCALCAEL